LRGSPAVQDSPAGPADRPRLAVCEPANHRTIAWPPACNPRRHVQLRESRLARRRIDGRLDASLPRLDVSQLSRRRRRPPSSNHTPTMNALFEAPQQQPSSLPLSSFVDPLSSYGVKKALASAWLAAVAAHTSLLDSGRQTVARDFFSNWERSIYTTHLRRSRDFARAALAAHRSAFCAARADVEIPASSDHEDDIPAGPVRFGTTSPLALRYADEVRFEDRPVVRGREIVLEKAFAGGIRFAQHVDLVTLAEIACQSNRVPDLFEKYCQRCAPVPLPSIVGGLSLLVARGILHERA